MPFLGDKNKEMAMNRKRFPSPEKNKKVKPFIFFYILALSFILKSQV